MRFAGIDVGAERHMVAIVGEEGEVLCRSSPFGEDAPGYARLFKLLGPPEGCLLALEATGHYWRNLFVALLAKGLRSRGAESITHAALCRGGTAADQDGRDRCVGDREVCCPEATAGNATARRRN
jgi:transposase